MSSLFTVIKNRFLKVHDTSLCTDKHKYSNVFITVIKHPADKAKSSRRVLCKARAGTFSAKRIRMIITVIKSRMYSYKGSAEIT